jgi:hypothetical protein
MKMYQQCKAAVTVRCHVADNTELRHDANNTTCGWSGQLSVLAMLPHQAQQGRGQPNATPTGCMNGGLWDQLLHGMRLPASVACIMQSINLSLHTNTHVSP